MEAKGLCNAPYKNDYDAFNSKNSVLWFSLPKWKSGLPANLPEIHIAVGIRP